MSVMISKPSSQPRRHCEGSEATHSWSAALRMDCSHGGLRRQGSSWHEGLPFCLRPIRGSSLTCEIRVYAGSTSHSVGALFGGRAMIPLSTGEAREAVPFFAAAFEAKQSIGRRPGSAEADQSSADDKR